MKTLYTFLILCVAMCLPQTLAAQKLEASAPSQVVAGEPFRVTYKVNTQEASGFRAPSFPEAIEVLAGPYTSTQSSYQMINGHTSSSSSITYTFTVCANKNGTFTIPAAHITAGGKAVSSNALRIQVSGTAQHGSSGGQQRGQQGAQSQPRVAGSRIGAEDLFIKVSANKRTVHEQEPILLTYKVYTLVDLTALNGKMPDLKGFHTQEIPLPQQKSLKLETYNGRPYRTVTWSQYVMFPQVTGKLEIPSIEFQGTVVQQNRSVDPFEAFFNGGSGYVEVKKSIKAPGLTVEVLPLPARPANFSGGVGRMNISAQIDKKSVRANDPVTLRVVVSGVGNLKLIKEPALNLPKDFDKYDAKVTDKTKLTANGVEGNMVYDIMIVPRHQGKYELPPVEFTYYDTGANAYKTVKTQGFTLDVLKGAGGSAAADYSAQSEVEQLNQDIRYIKLGAARQRSVGDFFYATAGYWVAVAVMLLAFVSLAVVFRRRAIDNANIGKLRAGKANKVATKRLRKARKLMGEGKAGEFYDETLRALWGYVGDKLSIPVEKLSRENIKERLTERSVEEQTVQTFIAALDECEFERYAPGDAAGNMSKTFEAAMAAIMQIENVMKHKTKPSAKALLWAVGLMLATLALAPVEAGAVTKANADSAYARQQYQQAVKDYEQLLRQGVSPELYFNLGNAYYRTGNVTRAILNYERAALLSPGDADIRYNLQLAQSKTIDKITPESEMFFFSWWRSAVSVQSVDGWAWTALWSLAVAVALLLVYLFASRVWLRKVGFFGSFAAALLFIFANVFAYQQRSVLEERKGAIVIASSVAVKSTPAKAGTDLFVIHEGTKVTVTDDSMNDWRKVRLADGRDGWLELKAIETI